MKVQHLNSYIPLKKMKDGDVAEVMFWPNEPFMTSKVIQRYKDIIIILGEDSGQSYPGILGTERSATIKVNILTEGTILEI